MEREKKWGNEMIYITGPKLNGNYTTKLGEYIIAKVLVEAGFNVKRPEAKNGYQPDWETFGNPETDMLIEVKTSNWTVAGTAGEKVMGTFLKYRNVSEIYNKPLLIICLAYQEYEYTFGKNNMLGNDIDEKMKLALTFYKNTYNIEIDSFTNFYHRFKPNSN